MSYIEIKNIFINLLGFTLSLYFLSDMLKYKLEGFSKYINNNIMELNLFQDERIIEAYNEFKEHYFINFTLKKLKDFKKQEVISKDDKKKIEELELDIVVLNVSFAYSFMMTNQNLDIFPEDISKDLNDLVRRVKFINRIKTVAIILTQICVILFIYLVF